MSPPLNLRLVKEVFRNFGMYLVDFMTMSKRTLTMSTMRAHVDG